MSGNVREWCNDWYGSYEDVIKESKKDAATGAILNPVGVQQGSGRVLRGGSCYAAAVATTARGAAARRSATTTRRRAAPTISVFDWC